MKCPKCKQRGEFGGFFLNRFGRVGAQFYCFNCEVRYVKFVVNYVNGKGNSRNNCHVEPAVGGYGN